MRILICIAIGTLLYLAHTAFIPIALGLLFALILSGPVEALNRLRVPRSVSAAVILIIVLAAMAGTVELIWSPAQQWYKSAPQTLQVMKRKLEPGVRWVAHVERLFDNASSIGSVRKPAGPPIAAVAPDKEGGPALIFLATREAMVSVLAFVIITLFLLTGGPPMLARMTAAFVDDLNAAHVLEIIEKVRGEVGRFYMTTFLINVGLGCATAGAMALCGMPTPYVWGILAALLNFIPYAGAATTLTALTLVAFVTFDGVGQVLTVAGSYLALATLEGQLIQPLFVGRRLEVNPLLVFVALWFGGLFWGIAGIVLATPTLVALKVVAENSQSGEALMQFLGPNDPGDAGRPMLGRLLPRRARAQARASRVPS